MELDEVDWELIRQLQLNGRKTFKELGEAVGYTGLGAKKRVEKLLKGRVIHTSALVNTEAMNLKLALIMMEMESAEAMRETIKRYRECPRVLNFFTTLGGYNLIALIMAEDQDTLESESMERCGLRSSEGIRRSEFYPIGKIQHSPFLSLRAYKSRRIKDVTPCSVKCNECPSFQAQKCVGCPSTKFYRGPLP